MYPVFLAHIRLFGHGIETIVERGNAKQMRMFDLSVVTNKNSKRIFFYDILNPPSLSLSQTLARAKT